MKLDKTQEVLKEITKLEIPISNTTHGEQIQQTYRNNLTKRLKEALYEDCKALFPPDNTDGILPYLVKEGVILEVPNVSIADNTDPNLCNGAISIEWGFTIKSLEYDAGMAAEELEFLATQKAKKAEEAERKKQEKIKRDKEAREAREFKRLKLAEAMAKLEREE